MTSETVVPLSSVCSVSNPYHPPPLHLTHDFVPGAWGTIDSWSDLVP